jgi:RNA polymerase sigma-70 factor (ECF subfamily)
MVYALDITSDAALVALARVGDHGAFTLLVRRHQARAEAVAKSLLRSAVDVAECLQEAWTTAWRRLDSLRGEAAFSGWLLRIVRNTCLMRLRSRRRRPEVSLDVRTDEGVFSREVVDVAPLCEDDLLAEELGQHIRRVAADLPEAYLVIHQMADLQDRSMKEIADELGISVPNVKTRLHRARSRMREALEPYLAGRV